MEKHSRETPQTTLIFFFLKRRILVHFIFLNHPRGRGSLLSTDLQPGGAK